MRLSQTKKNSEATVSPESGMRETLNWITVSGSVHDCLEIHLKLLLNPNTPKMCSPNKPITDMKKKNELKLFSAILGVV